MSTSRRSKRLREIRKAKESQGLPNKGLKEAEEEEEETEKIEVKEKEREGTNSKNTKKRKRKETKPSEDKVKKVKETKGTKGTRLTKTAKSEDSGAKKIKSEQVEKTRTRKAKPKIIKDMFATRLNNVTKYVGAHVSVVGGVQNAITNCLLIGGNAFAIFLKNQRRWVSPPLSQKDVEAFREYCLQHNYASKFILPHGSYLINLGNPDQEKREKSYQSFLEDLQRCESLGLTLYNFHPGSTVGQCTIETSIQHIANCINRAHKETSSVICVIENMAGAGNVIGSRFEELADIISRVDDKSRVGICIDTCHAFAAGYDLRTSEAYEETMKEFSRHIGFQYLRGMHLNDSETELGSFRDRHANIGKGHLGLEAFRLIMNDDRLNEIPLILETPVNESLDYCKEVELLYGLVGKTSPIVNNYVKAPIAEKNKVKQKSKKSRKKNSDDL